MTSQMRRVPHFSLDPYTAGCILYSLNPQNIVIHFGKNSKTYVQIYSRILDTSIQKVLFKAKIQLCTNLGQIMNQKN